MIGVRLVFKLYIFVAEISTLKRFNPGCLMTGLIVCGAILFEGISTTVALAAVAVLGYLVGLRRRHQAELEQVESELSHQLQRALENSRKLENITDGLLKATREALRQSGRLREAGHARLAPHASTTPASNAHAGSVLKRV